MAMVVDRAIRTSSPALSIPPWILAAQARAVVEQIDSGLLDCCLSQLRSIEMRGLHRPSVIQAIDARSKRLIGDD